MLGLKIFVTQRHTFKKKNWRTTQFIRGDTYFEGKIEYNKHCKNLVNP